jgi:hypothetical protein
MSQPTLANSVNSFTELSSSFRELPGGGTSVSRLEVSSPPAVNTELEQRAEMLLKAKARGIRIRMMNKGGWKQNAFSFPVVGREHGVKRTVQSPSFNTYSPDLRAVAPSVHGGLFPRQKLEPILDDRAFTPGPSDYIISASRGSTAFSFARSNRKLNNSNVFGRELGTPSPDAYAPPSPPQTPGPLDPRAAGRGPLSRAGTPGFSISKSVSSGHSATNPDRTAASTPGPGSYNYDTRNSSNAGGLLLKRLSSGPLDRTSYIPGYDAAKKLPRVSKKVMRLLRSGEEHRMASATSSFTAAMPTDISFKAASVLKQALRVQGPSGDPVLSDDRYVQDLRFIEGVNQYIARSRLRDAFPNHD